MYHIEAGKGTLSRKAYGLISFSKETQRNEVKRPAAGNVGCTYSAINRNVNDGR